MWYWSSCGIGPHVVLVLMWYWSSCGIGPEVVLVLMRYWSSCGIGPHVVLVLMWYWSACGIGPHVVLVLMWYWSTLTNLLNAAVKLRYCRYQCHNLDCFFRATDPENLPVSGFLRRQRTKDMCHLGKAVESNTTRVITCSTLSPPHTQTPYLHCSLCVRLSPSGERRLVQSAEVTGCVKRQLDTSTD